MGQVDRRFAVKLMLARSVQQLYVPRTSPASSVTGGHAYVQHHTVTARQRWLFPGRDRWRCVRNGRRIIPFAARPWRGFDLFLSRKSPSPAPARTMPSAERAINRGPQYPGRLTEAIHASVDVLGGPYQATTPPMMVEHRRTEVRPPAHRTAIKAAARRTAKPARMHGVAQGRRIRAGHQTRLCPA